MYRDIGMSSRVCRYARVAAMEGKRCGGRRSASRTCSRTFQTPKLEPGRTYAYTLKAEVTRDGRTLSETRQVTLRAGKPVTVEFGEMGSALTASR